MAVTASGAIGFIGLAMLMPTDQKSSLQANAMDGLKAMFNPLLLAGAGITVLAYAGSFACIRIFPRFYFR